MWPNRTAAHKNLDRLVHLEACFDFDAHFSAIRRPASDEGIKRFRVFEFTIQCMEGSSDPAIMLRTKRHMNSPNWSDPFQFWPNGSNAAMPGPEQPPLAPFKEWEKKERVLKSLKWFADSQTDIAVSQSSKRAIAEFVSEGVPASPSDVSAPHWPRAVQPANREQQEATQEQKEAAQSSRDRNSAEEEDVAPYGMSTEEHQRRQAASRAFEELRHIRRADLLVLLDAEGGIALAQATQAVDLQASTQLPISWWVNKRGGDRAGASDINAAFEKAMIAGRGRGRGRREWRAEISTEQYTVFMARPKADLLTSIGKVRAAIKAELSRIARFPWVLDGGRRLLVPVAAQ